MILRFSSIWGPGVAVLLLAGCAGRPPPPPPEPPRPPVGIEGRYRGTARLLVSNNRACPRSGPRVYELENGQVTLAYSAEPSSARGRPERVPLTAPVQPDGRIQASDGQGTMDGQLQDGLLEVTISSPVCQHRWTMRRFRSALG